MLMDWVNNVSQPRVQKTKTNHSIKECREIRAQDHHVELKELSLKTLLISHPTTSHKFDGLVNDGGGELIDDGGLGWEGEQDD